MKSYTTLVYTSLFLGELVVSLIVDHNLPQRLWDHKESTDPEYAPDADLSDEALQLPFKELEELVKSLIIQPDSRHHLALERAAALGAITLSGDPEDIHGWDWTPAGLLVAKRVVEDMVFDGLICPDCGTILETLGSSDHRVFCCWKRAEDLGLIRDEDTGDWSSPEGFQWRHSFGVRLEKALR